MSINGLAKRIDSLETTGGEACPGCQDEAAFYQNVTEKELDSHLAALIELANNPIEPGRVGEIMKMPGFAHCRPHLESCPIRMRLEAMSDTELDKTISSLKAKALAGT